MDKNTVLFSVLFLIFIILISGCVQEKNGIGEAIRKLITNKESLIETPVIESENGREPMEILKKYESNPEEFEEALIGERLVYYKQRKIGEAIVEGDQVVYQFDKSTKELLDTKIHWRENLPEYLPDLISKEQAELLVEGEVQFSNLYFISPDSAVFPIKPPPENPCWVVNTIKEQEVYLTVIDAVTGDNLGYGVPPPSEALSITGAQYSNQCSNVWEEWYTNARYWFDYMGYETEGIQTPWHYQMKDRIQSYDVALFYEIAHGGSSSFSSQCSNNIFDDYIYSVNWDGEGGAYEANLKDWMKDYPKVPFAFIGSCGGMCNTGVNSLSYEFRKGSNKDVFTLGYCGMGDSPCVDYCWASGAVLIWQTYFFYYMSLGLTGKVAFDRANAEMPFCSVFKCIRFEGDPNFKLVPKVKRTPCNDLDGDGFYPCVENLTDCNDWDSDINPEADELCNNIDDNCNGEIDEDVLHTYYYDGDGDGYGVVYSTELACMPPLNHVKNGGDCDDKNVSIHPLAREMCNSVDDNCNGIIDKEDNDGDGYFICDGSLTDCDDISEYINLGATEICGNEIDDDCDGILDHLDINSTNPISYEICGNEIDDNCDGITDHEDAVCTCERQRGTCFPYSQKYPCGGSNAEIKVGPEYYCSGDQTCCKPFEIL
ncbi:MAG: putative metal-binding motif-containing protein [archaeon]